MSSNQSVYCSVNVSLIKNPDLQKFWCLETIGIKDPMSKESDEEAIDRFCKTIKMVSTYLWLCILNNNNYLVVVYILVPRPDVCRHVASHMGHPTCVY